MDPYNALKRNVGRAIEFARIAEAGKDFIHGTRSTGKAQHIAVRTPARQKRSSINWRS